MKKEWVLPVKVTRWMKFKAKLSAVGEFTKLKWVLFKTKLSAKWVLFKVFLIKFFDVKQLAFATFIYEITCGYKAPKREKHVVLAKISRNAPVEDIKKKLFTLKPETEDCKFKVIEVKIQSAGNIKSV
jgi:hypothetical protein